MVDVNERIPHVCANMRHLVLQIQIVGVVQQKTVGLHVSIVRQIEVLVELAHLLEPTEAVNDVSLVGQLNCQVQLHLAQEGFDLLQEEVEV
jgi:hypothetical protein